jgi:hypothetical protein
VTPKNGVLDMKKMRISSPQFEYDGWMPDILSGYGKDESPELYIEGIPEGTVSLAVTMDDLDHPVIPGFNHWIAWNIDPKDYIPGALPKGGVIDNPIHIEQGLGYGKNCYRGPKPPFNGNHRYRFNVYALDIKLNLSPSVKKAGLIKAMEGHILTTGELMGKYQRRHG